MKTHSFLVALVFVLGFSLQTQAVEYPKTIKKETPAQQDARMKWWREARFGLFIHWGLYSIPGTEEWAMCTSHIPIKEYEKFADQFNPTKFDAKLWAARAKEAGVRYVVFTSKHHDGFCMYPSKVGDFNIMRTPFKRDIVKELADACRAEGLRFCLYYSIMDWHHPDAQANDGVKYNLAKPNPNFPRYVEQYMKPQLKELLANYGPLGVLWFDGCWRSEWTVEMGDQLEDYLRGLQPDLLINNRVGRDEGGKFCLHREKYAPGDFGTPEGVTPAKGYPGVDWETCMTTNGTWGYSKTDHKWKSSRQLIRLLVDNASKGGNLLLNVGPSPEGEFPPEAVERLAAIGAWMKVNGESIYATTATPFDKLKWGRCTKREDDKGATLYFHVFDWPANHRLNLPAMKGPIESAYLLSDASRKELSREQGKVGPVILLPEKAPDPNCSVVVVKIQGAP